MVPLAHRAASTSGLAGNTGSTAHVVELQLRTDVPECRTLKPNPPLKYKSVCLLLDRGR